MLRLTDVRVVLMGAEILRGVRLRVEAGEVVGLVGRNGAGKTTTFRAIMGLTPLREGSLELDGLSLQGLPAHRRAGLGLGYAPEDRRLIGTLTVEDNLLLPIWAMGLPLREAQARLEEVYALLPELKPLRRRVAASLSGGQGKMVALGRALMMGTRLVLLDEPFQGLAPALAQRYAEVLQGVRRAKPGLAFLISESNPRLIAGMLDRLYRIERGAVEEVRA